MIGEMIVWGFFSAIGWMGANWTVNKIFPEKPPVEQKVGSECNKNQEKKNIVLTSGGRCDQ
jgi:hypothetical protein